MDTPCEIRIPLRGVWGLGVSNPRLSNEASLIFDEEEVTTFINSELAKWPPAQGSLPSPFEGCQYLKIEALSKGDPESVGSGSALSDVLQFADRAVLFLRLAKAGPVFLEAFVYRFSSGEWKLVVGDPAPYTDFDRLIRLPDRNLADQIRAYTIRDGDDYEILRSLFQHHWLTSLDTVPGLRWFSKANRETNPRDRLVLLVFAVEHLLIGNTDTSNLRYKLALRGSWLLAKDPDTRRGIFEDLNLAYTIRSSLAHAGTISRRKKLKDEDIDYLGLKIEEYLRQLIRKRLADSALFEERSLDNLVLGIRE